MKQTNSQRIQAALDEFAIIRLIANDPIYDPDFRSTEYYTVNASVDSAEPKPDNPLKPGEFRMMMPGTGVWLRSVQNDDGVNNFDHPDAFVDVTGIDKPTLTQWRAMFNHKHYPASTWKPQKVRFSTDDGIVEWWPPNPCDPDGRRYGEWLPCTADLPRKYHDFIIVPMADVLEDYQPFGLAEED